MKERAKPENEKLSWAELANILNDKGPSVKKVQGWRMVNEKF